MLKKRPAPIDAISRKDKWNHIFALDSMANVVECIEVSTPWKKHELGERMAALYGNLSDKIHFQVNEVDELLLYTGSISSQAVHAMHCICQHLGLKSNISTITLSAAIEKFTEDQPSPLRPPLSTTENAVGSTPEAT